LTYDIGFLGGGQLARMSIQAAQRMGLRCFSIDPGELTPASQVADSLVGMLSSPEDIARVLERCERVTLENEFIPADAIREALARVGRDERVVMPGTGTLAIIQDKLWQRERYLLAGAPSPRAVPLEGDGSAAIEAIGFPMVLKARFGGYDGKGTRYARDETELRSHAALWSGGGWLAEEFVRFTRELAVMVVRTAEEECCFPTMETVQVNHVCDLTMPAELDASEVAIAAVRAVDGFGLFGVELFEAADGSLLINEIAPRPHNTGHYSLDWGGPSQFEVHVRAVMGYPIPELQSNSYGVMANILGRDMAGDFREGLADALKEPGVFVHWYGKGQAKPGRKMGHLNVVRDPSVPVGEAKAAAIRAREQFYQGWTKGV
jgi:5-(carboxyamino)imidazole ribonucleotide synthase